MKVGDLARFKIETWKQLGFRGRREVRPIVEVKGDACYFGDGGLHSYVMVHRNNIEKVLKSQRAKQ